MNKINNYIKDKEILSIDIIRGLNIVPTRLELKIKDSINKYTIEVEKNFRIYRKDNLLICFDDLFLDKDFQEMTEEKYQKQHEIEDTLLYVNLEKYKKDILNKKIIKVKHTSVGDVYLYLENKIIIQIINDNHSNDLCILRIINDFDTSEYLCKNNETINIKKKLVELKK